MASPTAKTNDGGDPGEDARWRAEALSKYGTDVVEATLPLYCGSHREMIEDDNVRGAVPACSPLQFRSSGGGAAPCPWRMNRPAYFFLCLLVGLRFHREHDELRLYLDARGERDLRNPGDSSVERRPPAGADGDAGGDELLSGSFVPEVAMPGHYRGYLSFPAAAFRRPGRYWFTFADIRRHASYRAALAAMEARGVPRRALLPVRDYPEVLLLEVPEEGGLMRAFGDGDGRVSYRLPGSPFEGESEEDERARFAPFVGDDVLRRHEAEGGRPRRRWWVNADEHVQADPQRMMLVDPAGRGIMMTMNDIDNETRREGRGEGDVAGGGGQEMQ